MSDVTRILVPSDLSSDAAAAAQRALRYAAAFEAHVEFLHVVSPASVALRPSQAGGSGGRSVLAATQTRLDTWVRAQVGDDADIEYSSSIIEGDVVQAVIKRSRSVSLVVLRSKGKDDLGDWLLGTKSERIAARAHCDVLVVVPRDHERSSPR